MGVVLQREEIQTLDKLDDYTCKVNEMCRSLQETEKEYVSDDIVFEAMTIIKNMRIEDAGDVLLYCAAMNLVNTYVKQKNSMLGYGFKRNIHYMTSILLNLDIDDVYIDYQDVESLLVVQIYQIQFSFHYIRKKDEIISLCNSRHHKNLVWDGIRKQKCAVTLYTTVRENEIRTCNLTFRGKSLQSKVVKSVGLYYEGKISFADLKK